MSVSTRPFGHPKARKFLKGSTIKFQYLLVKGDTLQESAELSLVAEALEGRGPLAKALKAEAKDLIGKFEKSNPDFKFSPFKRDRSKDGKKAPVAPKTKKASKAKAKPSKSKSAKPSKTEEAVVAVA